MTDIRLLQEEISEWQDRNFQRSEGVAHLGLTEEVGEIVRAVVKREEGIRGTREEWRPQGTRDRCIGMTNPADRLRAAVAADERSRLDDLDLPEDDLDLPEGEVDGLAMAGRTVVSERLPCGWPCDCAEHMRARERAAAGEVIAEAEKIARGEVR